MTSREHEYWTPEPIFRGETVFCLASGPSATQEVVDKLRGRRTIVVNATCHLAPWADILFFTDSGFYLHRRDLIRTWPGMVVTMSRMAKRELPDKVRRVKGCGAPEFPPRLSGRRPGFPPAGSPEIQQGRTSGHTAVSLAIGLGAARVCLVGYDMRLAADGREHHHSGEAGYGGPRDLSLYANEFVPGFNGWRAAAEASGVEILNCTPGSALKEFPFADLDEVLEAL
ncbi:MAG: hypothetical protein AB7F22_10580 [Reyranella sp.]|uniref:hypothetical protein n=1 Tax=Reyranella sp. TaxID=1929291 RepID=UPI003D125F6B